MLRNFTQTRELSNAYRLTAVMLFTALTILAARVSIEIGGPVPFTLQPLVVLLAGMVLGSRDGALSQMAYVGLIASGLPLDARALGAAALTGPTAGFLVGFIPAAFVTGYLVEIGWNKALWRWIAGVVGLMVLYMLGIAYLKNELGLTWTQAWDAVKTFVAPDLVKAFIAATATESGRQFLLQSLNYQGYNPNKRG